MSAFRIFIILICYYNQQACATYHTNFFIKRLECCSKDNATKFYSRITTNSKMQYLDFDVTLQSAVDETVGAVAIIKSSVDAKTFFPLFTIKEKQACKAAHAYLGEFWYDIERAAQLPPGACPIPKRRYHVNHQLLDYSKITLQTFPFGTLRVTINIVNNTSKSKDSLFCLFLEIENTIN